MDDIQPLDLGNDELTYKDIMANPQYSRATLVGSVMAILQQLTGINVIMLYSNTILGGVGVPSKIATPILNFVNLVGAGGGLWFLSKFGRRTLMIWGNIAMVIILCLAGVFSLLNTQFFDYLTLVMLALFIAAFEFTSGPITWLYMSEIMQDKATSFASALNWGIVVIISGSIPYLVRSLTNEGLEPSKVGYIFLACGVFTFLGLIFIFVFMKETKGKKKQDIEWMYSSNKEWQGKNGVKKLYFDKGDGNMNNSEYTGNNSNAG